MTEASDPASVSWHLDRRIPIAIIVAIAVQSGSAIWWASSVSSYMGNAAQQAAAVGVRVDRLENGGVDMNGRMARVETTLNSLSDQAKTQSALLLQILSETRSKGSGAP